MDSDLLRARDILGAAGPSACCVASDSGAPFDDVAPLDAAIGSPCAWASGLPLSVRSSCTEMIGVSTASKRLAVPTPQKTLVVPPLGLRAKYLLGSHMGGTSDAGESRAEAPG